MYRSFKWVPDSLKNISKALPHLIGNIFLFSKMGISRFFIWIFGLIDIIDWSNICLQKQCVCVPWASTNILSFLGPPQRKYVIWMERSLRDLKWVFNGIQFHHLHRKYMNGFAPRHQLHQRPFCFFTFMKSYCNHGYGLTTQNPWLWVNHIKPTIMVRGQPHKTHSCGYGSTTQNPRLWVNHTKPTVMG